MIEDLYRPYGLALNAGCLYVGEPESIKRYKYDAKAMTAGSGEEVVSLARDGLGGGHWTRSLLFDARASSSTSAPAPAPTSRRARIRRRAAINCYNPDGSGHEIYASGTRNPIGLHWYPGTDTLWAAVQERDSLGDDLVPDYFTHIQQGGFYGWPYAYTGPNEDPAPQGPAARSGGEERFRATSSWARTSRCSTSSSTPANNSRREYRGGAFSGAGTARGTAPSA